MSYVSQRRTQGYSVLVNHGEKHTELIVEIKDKYWYPPEKQEYNKSIVYTIYIKALFRNFSIPTTIHTIRIEFDYKGKPYNISTVQPIQIKMPNGHSTNEGFSFLIREQQIQIVENPTNVRFIVEHTYEPVETNIDEIPKISS